MNERGGNVRIGNLLKIERVPDIRYINKDGKVNKQSYSGERNIKSFKKYLNNNIII